MNVGYNERMNLISARSENRLPWVDALRGVAVLLVLGRHLPAQFVTTGSLSLLPLIIWRRIGWIGVDLFFVISGFLVSGLLFREYQRAGKINIWRFFIRRAIRILIPFYIFLVLASPLRLSYMHFYNLCVEFFFLQGYFHSWVMWNHTWTLAVEEHFYLFLGLLLFILSHQKTKREPFRLIIMIWGLLSIGCLFMRIGTPYDSPGVLFQSHLRFDALFFGVLIAYFYHFRFETLLVFVRRFRFIILVAAAACLAPAFFLEVGREPFMTRFGLACLYLGFGGLLTVGLSITAKPPKYLITIGRISYSAYLWHIAARIVALSIYPDRSFSALDAWLFCGLYATVALGAGWLSYRLIEKPTLEWRDRRFA